MQLKALTVLATVLGTSTVAFARPTTVSASASFGVTVTTNVHRTPLRTVYARIHHTTRPVVLEPGCEEPSIERPMYPSNNVIADDASVYNGGYPVAGTRYNTWLALTQPTRIDRGRQFISDLPTNLGWFHSLRLQNLTGQSAITQVYIQFQNGEEQIVRLNHTMNRWSPTIDIDLKGNARQLKRVIVSGSTNQGSAYQLLAI